MTDAPKEKCAFCGEPEESVQTIVKGPTVSICDECVKVCVDAVEAHRIKRAVRKALQEIGHD